MRISTTSALLILCFSQVASNESPAHQHGCHIQLYAKRTKKLSIPLFLQSIRTHIICSHVFFNSWKTVASAAMRNPYPIHRKTRTYPSHFYLRPMQKCHLRMDVRPGMVLLLILSPHFIHKEEKCVCPSKYLDVGRPWQSSLLHEMAPLWSQLYVSTAATIPEYSFMWTGVVVDLSRGRRPWMPIALALPQGFASFNPSERAFGLFGEEEEEEENWKGLFLMSLMEYL